MSGSPGAESAGPPLDITFVIARYPPATGGTEIQAAALAGALRGRGHRVRVLTQRLPGISVPDEEGVIRLRPAVGGVLASFCFGCRVAFDLVRRPPDVVQSFLLSSPSLFAALGARLAARPVVVKTGGGGAFSIVTRSRSSFMGRLRLGLIRRLADRFVAPAPAAIDELAAAGMARERCMVIPNGVDSGRFRPSGRPVGGRARSVVFAGRLEAQKGPLTALRAWRLVTNRVPEARLAMIGDGSLRPEVERLVERLGLASSVTLAGAIPPDEMPAWYRAVGVVLLPSLGEGLSNTLLEAMSSGLAPVLSDIAEHRWLSEGGTSAVLVPPGDEVALANALAGLLDDPERCAELGRKALERARSFSLDRAVDGHLALYRSLGAGCPATGGR